MSAKPIPYTATWYGKRMTMTLTAWSRLTDKSRSYFEHRLRSETLQSALDRLVSPRDAAARLFLSKVKPPEISVEDMK